MPEVQLQVQTAVLGVAAAAAVDGVASEAPWGVPSNAYGYGNASGEAAVVRYRGDADTAAYLAFGACLVG